MNNVEKMLNEAGSDEMDYSKRYAYYISKLLQDLDWESIAVVIKVLQRARNKGSTIFLAGNGGSASTCSHFAEDLSWGQRQKGKKPFKIFCLTDNIPIMTAVANDEGYENIFLPQLETSFTEDDILVVISASGNSPNLIKAVRLAHDIRGMSIGIVGFDGGELKNLCRLCIHVPTMLGEYGPVEDIHLLLEHLITTYLAGGA
jgi:D-sedoheptulose 7-phosphate isomerase